MDALTKALNSGERSYQLAKASTAVLRNELVGAASYGQTAHRTDFNKADMQLNAFRGWVYACVRVISQKIAGQQIKVGKKKRVRTRKKANYQVEEIDHPLQDRLCSPNSIMTGWSLMFATVSSLELTGRALWWFDGDEVYYIPTNWIEDIVGTRKLLKFKVRPRTSAAESVELSADDCVYFYYPSPQDHLCAASPLMAAGIAVEADQMLQRSQVSTFQQGINPKHALIVGKNQTTAGTMRPTLTASQRRQLIESIRSMYSGVVRHGEPLILDNLISDVKTLSRTPTEMDFMGSGQVTKERITQIFGVNPIILGQVEGANRASSLAAEEHFAEFTINPKIELLSQTLTATLGPRNDDLVVWIEKVVPQDAEMELAKWNLLTRTGSVRVDELREFVGIGPLGEGGEELVSMPAGSDDKPLKGSYPEWLERLKSKMTGCQ